jgi:hypothetical protein
MARWAPVALLGVGVLVGYAVSGLAPLRSFIAPKALRPACAWSERLDAVRAAPLNHKVLLENEKVRVLDVTVRPGEREQVHAHCRPSVMYLMQEGIYRDYDGNGRLLEEVATAPPASQFPMILWLGPQGPHAVHNLDSKPTRLLRIELKD